MKAQLVDSVEKSRWRQAQQWEEEHWVRSQRARARYGKNLIWRLLFSLGRVGKYRGDDWNLWWKRQFHDYGFLPDSVMNAIEVGCGPYTNMQHIVQHCRPQHVFLSDPLIKTYIQFKLAYTADAYRKGFCILDDHPLEEIPYRDNYFDLVVMINVLDHVENARKCMENVIRITKRGGILILGQDLTNNEDLRVLEHDRGLVGHPVKLPEQWFGPFLSTHFTPVLHRVLSREEGREPSHHYATLIYAGTKL